MVEQNQERHMPVYGSADEVYTYVGGAFREAAAQPEIAAQFAAVGSTLCMHCTDPDAAITIRLADPVEVITGDDGESAEIHLYLKADDADRFLRGTLNIPMAMVKRQVRASGPIDAVLKLVPATKPLIPIYERLTASRPAAAT
ncbi:SCP2 sterol-binding domain-containing protein [Paraconexibacter antarcticus]|uniref:SCP2 sterol-binding domain-containing protein n=1 Tax=Paraconexibacter antarcticus TaxID=2949664 RepID=A0ABY5DZZ4_9ACTN|nr:SCP2 sterol-binding domain-containing protein [Paraconexibacter antarcticus]UTI66165.1 SCP2 sterol-binding domain-containing protein [Paraconexibacter antarcticus]